MIRNIDNVELLVDAHAVLGEGPVWDIRHERLVWVDIRGRSIHSTDPGNGHTDTIDVPHDIGAVVPRAGGGYLAALRDGFWEIDDDGTSRRVVEVAGTGAHRRFNDGKCDPAGRFWAGTMADDETPGAGALYRLDTDGQVTRMVDDVTISNGLAWSADGSTMFYIDTPTQRIDAFDFDVAAGTLGERRTVVEIPAASGSPDGMAIDDEGGLWVALWGGSAVHRYVAGSLDTVISMPVSRPTSCTFGGPQLDELFITSASDGLGAADLAAQPAAGGLFRVRPGVSGPRPVPYGTG